MGKFGLQIKGNLENVTDLQAQGDDFRWHLKLKCGNCGEETPKWLYVTEEETVPLKGGRGEANLVSKCKLCSREYSIDILNDEMKSYTLEDSNSFKTIAAFECRGCEPSAFSFRNGFTAKGAESSTVFKDINLEENEWVDYDEKSNESVGVYELTYQFKKL